MPIAPEVFFPEVCAEQCTTAAAMAIQTGPRAAGQEPMTSDDDGEAAVTIVSHGLDVGPHSHFEMASLSKMVGAAFSLDYFERCGFGAATPVHELLRSLGITYRVPVPEGFDAASADRLTLEHLVSHSGLNMHYVRGCPADPADPRPIDIELYLHGHEHNPVRLELAFEPGTSFKYSGGGFIMMQYLLEKHSGQPIEALMRPWLDALGMKEFTFDAFRPGVQYIDGVQDDGSRIRKQFPALAAGAFATVAAMQRFQHCLAEAYRNPTGFGPAKSPLITHETARRMLHPLDRNFDFMGSHIGVGAFVVVSGKNLYMAHQGANDGYRVLCMHCFDGPDYGKGFVTVATGDTSGVLHNAIAAQQAIRFLELRYVDYAHFDHHHKLRTAGVSQENEVNAGYKQLVFRAFAPLVASVDTVTTSPRAALATLHAVSSVSTQGTALFSTPDKALVAQQLEGGATPSTVADMVAAAAGAVGSVDANKMHHVSVAATNAATFDEPTTATLMEDPAIGHDADAPTQ